MSNVFIALQANEESRAIIEAIMADNPNATLHSEPAMVKIDCPSRLIVKRESIEELLGRSYNLQEMQVNLITLSGHVDEDDDTMTLCWNN